MVIDETQWLPKKALRKVVGREIRLDGQALTDLDAVCELKDSLLVVSCKSKIYSAQYDAGDFSIVRNHACAAESAALEWNDIVQTLRARPVGDNYDFQRFHTIFGVVVMPHVIYVNLGPALDFVQDGLRAVVSIAELRTWLSGGVTSK
jgi:hypothetical protein